MGGHEGDNLKICKTCKQKTEFTRNGDCQKCVDMWIKKDDRAFGNYYNAWQSQKEYYGRI